jgi:exo-beta-1,3-glucanase (GH17 family)
VVKVRQLCALALLTLLVAACGQLSQASEAKSSPSAAEIFGNPHYPAIAYGGYRGSSRDQVPTVGQLKEDMKILAAMGIKLLRTYNTSHYPHAQRLLEAIQQLRDENPDFEMYVMLGAWIESENAWTDNANHHRGHKKNNTIEVETAVAMANQYPDIVKAIAVGNEAMVQWAVKYFVYPKIILKWVNYLQKLKRAGKLPKGVWITSSDNYESWGGGSKTYHTPELAALVEAVDFVSLHTYGYHDSHYNPDFWRVPSDQESLSDQEIIEAAMDRAVGHAKSQYQAVVDYIQSIGLDRPAHIGESGWASIAAVDYGPTGSKASDELKQRLFHNKMRAWTDNAGISFFFFEAFDERWKDPSSAGGSENNFGLIKLNNQAKYTLWDLVDKGAFDGLTRDGKPITKTYGGELKNLMADVELPPFKSEAGMRSIVTSNPQLVPGKPIAEDNYIVVHKSLNPDRNAGMTYPSSSLKLIPWEGTSTIEISPEGVIEVVTRLGNWWGCGLQLQSDRGDNLSDFEDGYIHFDIRGDSQVTFNIGFQTGLFLAGNLVNNFVTFGPKTKNKLSHKWMRYSFPLSALNRGADLTDVTSPLYLWSDVPSDLQHIYIKNIYFSKQ